MTNNIQSKPKTEGQTVPNDLHDAAPRLTEKLKYISRFLHSEHHQNQNCLKSEYASNN